MSFDAADWAMKQPIDNTHRKFVLVLIAQHANDDDEAWPSVGRIAERAAMCDKAVRNAIGQLVQDGFLRLSGNTRNRHYHLLRSRPGARKAAPVPTTEAQTTTAASGTEARKTTPVSVSPIPVNASAGSGTGYRPISHQSIINPSGDAGASSAHGMQAQDHDETLSPKPDGKPDGKLDGKLERDAKPPFPPRREPRPSRGTRLSQDWQPSPGDIAFAGKHPGVDWRIEAERFRNYWLAKAGSNAVKQDWPRTWANWIINEARYARERAQRAPGRGQSAPPPTMSPDELWALRVSDYRRKKFWLRAWGPKPDEPGCRAPAHCLGNTS